jgi:hypothetical protein
MIDGVPDEDAVVDRPRAADAEHPRIPFLSLAGIGEKEETLD